MTLITGLGDAALLLPAAALVLLYLLQTRSWRAATGWVAALTLCAGLTVVAKMMFHACGERLPVLDIRSPSGHTSLSTTFYGCGALMLCTNETWDRRLAPLLASLGLILTIAASRVALHAHTMEEAAAGLAIGLVCVAFFASYYLPRAIHLQYWPIPLTAILAFALLTHGRHLSAEGLLDRLADRLHLAQYFCPLRENAGVGDHHMPPGAVMTPLDERLVPRSPPPSIV